ncbi:TetR family transcriptional regulator [Streptomyces ossamyceticus]|nr:TetR family transcriptional regulator [Streptomyces ossamyceticus]
MVVARKTSGSCTVKGDSGNPVYTINCSSAATAKGIISGGGGGGGGGDSGKSGGLLDPCWLVFTDIGLANNAFLGTVARSRAVAEEAGVTHGLVVHHFGSRDALIEAALEHAVRTSASTSSLEPGTGDIADFAAGLADMVTREPALQTFQYELVLESRRRPELLPQIRALYDEYFQATERELSRSLTEGTSPALTRLVFAALEGLVLHQLILDEPDVTESALKELRSLLTRKPGEGE